MASINGVIAANAPHPWVIGALWGLCVVDGFFPPVPSESLVVALAAGLTDRQFPLSGFLLSCR